MIRSIILVRKPRYSRVILRNSQSVQSYAFSKSILSNKHHLLSSFLWMWYIISWAMIELCNTSHMIKNTLKGINKFIQERPNTAYNKFGDSFEKHIVEDNPEKILKSGGDINLRNRDNHHFNKLGVNGADIKIILNFIKWKFCLVYFVFISFRMMTKGGKEWLILIYLTPILKPKHVFNIISDIGDFSRNFE